MLGNYQVPKERIVKDEGQSHLWPCPFLCLSNDNLHYPKLAYTVVGESEGLL